MTPADPKSPSEPTSTALDSAHAYRVHWDRMRETSRRREEDEAEAAAALLKERLINLKMQVGMIDRLDEIAKDAGASRSQLIRQIVADFLNHVWVQGIRFRGSTLGFRHRPTDEGFSG